MANDRNPLSDDDVLRRYLAILAVVWALSAVTAAVCYDAYLGIKHLSWAPPSYFVGIVEATIGSAVLVLGTTAASAVRGFLEKRKTPDASRSD